MTEPMVRVFKFGRFWKRYVLDHSKGKLIRIPGRLNGLNFWKGIASILFGRPQSKDDDASKKFDDWKFEDTKDYGIIKEFYFGRNVLVYSVGDVPYMRVGRKLERITSGGVVRQYWFGPFCFYCINCGSIRTFALDTQWFDFISRFIDPTYDQLDRLDADFSGYVKGIFERCAPSGSVFFKKKPNGLA